MYGWSALTSRRTLRAPIWLAAVSLPARERGVRGYSVGV